MKTQKSTNKSFIALSCGILLAFLLCGIPFFWLMTTGRFQQFMQPFAYAARTAIPVPTISETPTSKMVVSETPPGDAVSLSYDDRLKMAGPHITNAHQYTSQGAYAEAILAWDKVLKMVPEWAEGYYNRGQAYLKLLNNQRSQEEFLHYLSLAGADFDKAIELAPYEMGDYYYGRFQYYEALSANQLMRVDSDHLEQIALDNLLMANQLGTSQQDAEIKLALVYSAVGKCDEAMKLASRLIGEAEEPATDAIGSLSMSYLCKNDFPNALKYMDEVVKRIDNCRSRYDRARILYVMGKLDDARADLDYSIAKDPYYCGMRYFLRGLIYADKGDLEKAEDDLYFGMGQTWEQGGLLSYVQGKIALAQGDKESAIQYFREAEASYEVHDPILVKMQEELAALSVPPLEVTPSFPFATTIPLPTSGPTTLPALTPRPTSSPDPSIPTPVFTPDFILQFAQISDLEKTVGPVQLIPGYESVWRFQPAHALDHREVQRLSVWLISSDTSQPLPRQFSLWNFRHNMWGEYNEVHWGENQINDPNEYVSHEGDVYIYFKMGQVFSEATVDEFCITLILQRTDGSIEVHGVTP